MLMFILMLIFVLVGWLVFGIPWYWLVLVLILGMGTLDYAILDNFFGNDDSSGNPHRSKKQIEQIWLEREEEVRQRMKKDVEELNKRVAEKMKITLPDYKKFNMVNWCTFDFRLPTYEEGYLQKLNQLELQYKGNDTAILKIRNERNQYFKAYAEWLTERMSKQGVYEDFGINSGMMDVIKVWDYAYEYYDAMSAEEQVVVCGILKIPANRASFAHWVREVNRDSVVYKVDETNLI